MLLSLPPHMKWLFTRSCERVEDRVQQGLPPRAVKPSSRYAICLLAFLHVSILLTVCPQNVLGAHSTSFLL